MPRVPPHDDGAEQAVVGSMVIDESVCDLVADIIGPEDFYLPSCRAVYDAALACRAKGRPIDFQTLQTELGPKMAMVGGMEGLSGILDSVPTAAHAEAYAQTVKEKAILRRLIIACRTIAEGAYEATELEMFLADSQARITAATDHSSERPWEHLGDLAAEQVEQLKNAAVPPGMPTGFHDLDEKTKGLFPDQLTIVAGRPSSGKTAFASSIIQNTFRGGERVKTLFCSLEMSKHAVTSRYISMATGIPILKIMAGEVDVNDWPVIDAAKRYLMETPLWIADVPAMTLAAVRARARRLQAQHGIDLIVVDYLQLMRPTAAKDANREQQVASISAGLKEIAKEFHVPVIALSQLNRAVEARPDKRPNMADLRESGAIEQDADLILFVYRDELYNEDSPDKGMAEIIIGKQRNGCLGKVKLEFDGPRVTFRELGGARVYLDPEPPPRQPDPPPAAPSSPKPVDPEVVVKNFAKLGVSEDFLVRSFGPKETWSEQRQEITDSYRGFRAAKEDA